MKVYAFDVDETLYLSHGPVQWEALVALRAEGHVLGLCGNWAAVTLQVVCAENSDSDVLMMQPADEGLRYDASDPLDGSRYRRILVQ